MFTKFELMKALETGKIVIGGMEYHLHAIERESGDGRSFNLRVSQNGICGKIYANGMYVASNHFVRTVD